ncbi:MAG: AzlD domain-containing protein [Gammaproteobacteria bacterium]|nr:AzlD domain-containing protein [Gammaproteobacteria bacterium]
MSEWALIAGMAALTFLPRYIPFALAGRIHLSPLLTRALHYVPIAVLSVIVSQTTFMRAGDLYIAFDNHHLIAASVAFVVALLTRHMFLTIILGMLAFAAAEWLTRFASV